MNPNQLSGGDRSATLLELSCSLLEEILFGSNMLTLPTVVVKNYRLRM